MQKLSILLLTRNGEYDLHRLLPALFRQKTTASFEVIAIDSSSSDGTLDVLGRYPIRIEQIPASQFHHARTRNLAASMASGDILIFLSQDAIPATDGWLDALISNFADSTVGAVYGRQFPKPDSSLERSHALDAVYGDIKLVKDPANRNGMGYRFYHFSDANAAIRRTAWDAVRFPEELKVFEDLGIAKRLLDSGWKIIYEPEAAVFHSHQHTTVGLFKRYFDIGYTLKLLQIWDAPGTKKSMVRDMFKLVKGKLQRVGPNDSRKSTGHGIRQDIAKSLGIFLGLNQNCLPLPVKRRLSAYRVFE